MVVLTFSKLCELLKSLTVAASAVVQGPLKAVEEGDDDSNFKANDDLYFDRAVSLLIALTPLPRVTVSNWVKYNCFCDEHDPKRLVSLILS